MTDFDLENPVLPKAIRHAAMTSGGYSYPNKIKRKAYEESLHRLQI